VGKKETASVEKTELIAALEPQVIGKKRPVEQLSYFAVDGSYGDAVGLTIIDTGDWVAEDFDLIEDASDSDRPEVARLISDWIQLDRKSEEVEGRLSQLGVDAAKYL
jgi:hypothetical protein